VKPAGLWALAALGVLAWAPEAKTAGPCDALPNHNITSCEQQTVDIFEVQSGAIKVLASARIQLDPKRMYWACCATDASNAARPAWMTSTYFVVTRADDKIQGPIEQCKHEIATSIDSIAGSLGVDAIWSERNEAAHAVILGPAETQQAGTFPYCEVAFADAPHGSVPMGSVWVASVLADDVGDE
jgi:hypothetical protein